MLYCALPLIIREFLSGLLPTVIFSSYFYLCLGDARLRTLTCWKEYG
uniref:Uncharacterized protein n=1 Tax=Arundo donax TaxID=35708 RepID=A0A0A9FXJ1_ARUDO